MARSRIRAKPSPNNDPLYSRKDASRLFLGGISVASMKRLEAEGILEPIRLNKHSPSAQVFYRHSNLVKVAQRDEEEE
jgi:hypothetical protein